MTLSRSQSPRDARALRRALAEKEALLAERDRSLAEKEALLAERDRALAARDSEIYAKTLQIEHLKAQLAVLRRARFGRSSEKLDREIGQISYLRKLKAETAKPKAPSNCSTCRSDCPLSNAQIPRAEATGPPTSG